MNPLTTHLLATYVAFGGALSAVIAFGWEFVPLAVVAFLGIGLVYQEFKRIALNQSLLEDAVRTGMERRAQKGEVSLLTTDEFDA